MSIDTLFIAVHVVIAPAWLLLLFAPRSRWTQLTEAVEGILNPARKESKA